MNKLIQYNSDEWQEHFEYIKGHYYAYVKTKDGKKYLFDSDFDKKESIKGVYKYLGVKNKKEYSQIDKDNCTVPLFYKYTGDMSLIGINSFVKEAMKDSADYVVIPFDYEDKTYIHVD